MQQPGQGDVRRLRADLGTQLLVRLQSVPVAFDGLPHLRRGPASVLALLQDTAEQATAQRAPWDQPYPVVAQGGDDFEFDGAGGEVVQALLGGQTQEVAGACLALRGRDLPAGEVAAAHIGDLALADQLFRRLPDLLPRSRPVDVVHLVQVDGVGPQAAQAGLGGPADLVGGQVLVVRAEAHRLVRLRGEHDLVAASAAPAEPASDDLLGQAVALLHVRALRAAVDVRGVEQVDARVHRGVHDRETGGLVGGVPEVHGAERETADLQTAAAEMGVLHGFPYWRRGPGGCPCPPVRRRRGRRRGDQCSPC